MIFKVICEFVDLFLEEVGGFFRSIYSIFLLYEFIELLKFIVDVGYLNDEFVFSLDCEDECYFYKVGVEYEFYRNIIFVGFYIYEECDLMFEIVNYIVNVFFLSINILLED